MVGGRGSSDKAEDEDGGFEGAGVKSCQWGRNRCGGLVGVWWDMEGQSEDEIEHFERGRAFGKVN